MLALSTFRLSDRAVEEALSRAEKTGSLLVVFVADMYVEKYLADTEVGLYPRLQEEARAQLLAQHEAKGRETVAAIAVRAKARGIRPRTSVSIGRFALRCLAEVRRAKPVCVVTTRAKRPEWLRRMFGSPVDTLIAEAGCPVLEK
jgi:nucleotide-binding universal stress UspA family protein